MIREPLNVLGHNKVHALIATLNVANLEDLRVVAQHVWGHLEGRNVDNVDVWVLSGKYATDLSVFALQELVHRNAFGLFNGKRVDMDFNAFASLDSWPLLSELFHHFLPYKEGLVCQLVNPLFRLLLELE